MLFSDILCLNVLNMKKALLLLLFITSFSLVALVFLSVPVLLGRGVENTAQRIEALKVIDLPGKTLFVSDFHLTDPEARAYLNTEGISHVVIVGDFFHSPTYFAEFGDTTKERIENGLGVFLPKEFQGDVYFISAWTHDPQFDQLEFEYGGVKFLHVGKAAKFSIQGTLVTALHGNELHDGVIGGGISWLLGKFGMPLPLERFAKTRFGIDKDTWFIAGHSHVPALHEKSKTANTGSFVGVPFNNLIFRIPVATGIVVGDGEVKLVHFNTPPSSKIYSF
jgi:predicted phosphodiesterase